MEHTTCLRDEWRCKNHECINADFVCDHTEDCTDGSDEVECGDEEEVESSRKYFKYGQHKIILILIIIRIINNKNN